jgi:hypothetical protein
MYTIFEMSSEEIIYTLSEKKDWDDEHCIKKLLSGKKLLRRCIKKSIEKLAAIIPQNTLLKGFIETFCGKNNSLRHCVERIISESITLLHVEFDVIWHYCNHSP